MMAIAFKFFWVGLQALIEFVLKPANLVIAGILCLIVYGVGFHKGDNYRDRKWQAKITIERVKQEHAVADADAAAVAVMTRLQTELEQSNAQINELMAEADSDSNAARPALGTPSVQRLNRIGPRRLK
jgi:hypothetical protein